MSSDDKKVLEILAKEYDHLTDAEVGAMVGKNTLKEIRYEKVEADGTQKIVLSVPIPPNQLSMHAFWLTDRVPKAIQNHESNLILMYEVRDGTIWPEWFVLLYWGTQYHCLPVLTHYSMLEKEIGEWNLTALYRAASYGLNVDEEIGRFVQNENVATEPTRVFRRQFVLSHATLADSSS